MSAFLGLIIGAGLVLIMSPWLWPRGERAVRAPRTSTLESRASEILELAGFAHVAPRVLGTGMVAAGVIAAAIAWLATGVGVLSVLAACAAGASPVVWLRSRAAKLVRQRRSMWPDVCDLLVGSVRAGLSLPDAIAVLGESAPQSLRPAFAAFERDMRVSGHFPSSIDRLKHALSDPMADRIIETLRMAREVGGTELVPVLRALSVSIRADAALRGEVESKQSWTKGAAVLGVVAPWIVLAVLSLRPEAAQAYTA